MSIREREKERERKRRGGAPSATSKASFQYPHGLFRSLATFHT